MINSVSVCVTGLHEAGSFHCNAGLVTLCTVLPHLCCDYTNDMLKHCTAVYIYVVKMYRYFITFHK